MNTLSDGDICHEDNKMGDVMENNLGDGVPILDSWLSQHLREGSIWAIIRRKRKREGKRKKKLRDNPQQKCIFQSESKIGKVRKKKISRCLEVSEQGGNW